VRSYKQASVEVRRDSNGRHPTARPFITVKLSFIEALN